MEATNNPTEYKQFLYKKVIEAAYEAFTSKGIRAVKMDDLAKALSISKRTLYEIFDDKEQLLLACIEENSKCFREHMEKFALKKNPSPIAIILEFYRFQMIQLNNIRPEFFVDINRYPKAVKWINNHKEQTRGEVKKFFDQGRSEGYFVDNIDFELIAMAGDAIRDFVMRSKLFRKYSMKKIFHDLVFTIIRGICTQKGIMELDHNFEKIKA